jgi:hypothetical protein
MKRKHIILSAGVIASVAVVAVAAPHVVHRVSQQVAVSEANQQSSLFYDASAPTTYKNDARIDTDGPCNCPYCCSVAAQPTE